MIVEWNHKLWGILLNCAQSSDHRTLSGAEAVESLTPWAGLLNASWLIECISIVGEDLLRDIHADQIDATQYHFPTPLDQL